MATGLPTIYARHRYGVLFYSLLASMAVLPVMKPLGFDGDALQFFLAANLVAAVLAVGDGAARRAALVAVGIAIVARLAAGLLDERALSSASLAVWSILALVAIVGALRFALRGKDIGAEQVYAALSIYLLAGFFFGLIYSVLEQSWPGSLTVGGAAVSGQLPVTTATYFSFVTLASLGYGDVLPVSDPARGLAIAEVVGGQLYLAVLVARLVGAWR